MQEAMQQSSLLTTKITTYDKLLQDIEQMMHMQQILDVKTVMFVASGPPAPPTSPEPSPEGGAGEQSP
jgi:hypothetical protein